MGLWLLWVTLMWRVEVEQAKDEFVLRDSWSVRHVIRWADVTGWKKRRISGDVLICNRIKGFTIGLYVEGCWAMMAELDRRHIRQE